jgi:CBS domain containing-hemolysin-like protein
VTLLLIYVALALGVSFLCSIMEAVLLSVSPSYVARIERDRPALGRRLKSLKEDVDRPLAAILSLNTIAHTVGAAGAGAQAAAVFGSAYVGVISAVLTFLILVLSEIIPKTLGAVYWRALAPLMVRVLIPIIVVLWPLVKMAEGLSWLIARNKEKATIHREEFIAMAHRGEEEGILHEDESRIMKNLFRFRLVRAEDIMTPRTVLFMLPEKRTVSKTVTAHPDIRFSRIPVYGEDQDDVTGFVLKNDLLLWAARGKGQSTLAELRRPLTAVPGDLALRDLLERMMNERTHIFLVVDEYGGTEGVVTMEDVVETLLGLEIVDEADAVQDMQELARQQWVKRAKRLGIIPEEGGEDGEGLGLES